MKHPMLPTDPRRDRSGERGAALILALMVSLVLMFLGLGLLLQTSLGLQASGTDRWVAKALYAAEAGAMMQIEMVQMGVLGAPGSFILADDPDLPGLLKTQFNVTVTTLCETEPQRQATGFQKGYSIRYFHVRSEAARNVGDLAGLTRAVVEIDVAAQPYDDEAFEAVGECY
jgi:Tfp pilus assembly protein PilX